MSCAAIAGLCGLGLKPRATLELPTSQRRLDRIFAILRQCRYSLHDLSRVELSGDVPRFNMPFELGLAVAMRRRGRHDWWVLESRAYRLQRSLSDLNGTDPLVHGGRPRRLIQILENTFARPSLPDIPLIAIRSMVEDEAIAHAAGGASACWVPSRIRSPSARSSITSLRPPNAPTARRLSAHESRRLSRPRPDRPPTGGPWSPSVRRGVSGRPRVSPDCLTRALSLDRPVVRAVRGAKDELYVGAKDEPERAPRTVAHREGMFRREGLCPAYAPIPMVGA